MHPNKAFDWAEKEAMLRFAANRSFAHVFVGTDDGPFVVHVPLLVTAKGKIQFHISRRNRGAAQFADRHVLISISDRDAYQSANWYASDNQVPTWHYETVEIEGTASTLPDEGLIALLDGLSDEFERRYSPDQPWTRAKMAPGTFEAMTRAIVGFEIDPIEIRGTRKFNQHKGAEDRAATIAGQERAGRADIVAAMQETAF